MSNLPCEIVQDLLPSYIDHLTSEKTNELVKDHLDGCETCTSVYESMTRDAQAQNKPDEEDKKELDFLKKNRRKNRRVLFGSLAAAAILILSVIAARFYLVGDPVSSQWVGAKVQVEGNHMAMTAFTFDSARVISSMSFTEENGVVTAVPKAVLVSPFHSGEFHGEYTFPNEIREVWLKDRIVWENGANISAQAASLFATRHDYIGDMPANGRTALAMNVAGYLGPYENELQTAEPPYGWKLVLLEDISPERAKQAEKDMRCFACGMLAVVGNLDHVTFSYSVYGEQKEMTVDAAEASSILGQDIKNAGKSAKLLDELLKKAGLDSYAFSVQETAAVDNDDVAQNPYALEELAIQVVIQTDEPIEGLGMDVYLGDELVSSMFGVNANETPIKVGDSMYMNLDPGEVARIREKDSLLQVAFSVGVGEGTTVPVSNLLRVAPEFGSLIRVTLTGSEEEGFTVSQ